MTQSKSAREREEILRILNQARDVTISGIGTLQGCKSQLERLITLTEHGGSRHVEDKSSTELDDAIVRELHDAQAKLTNES